MKNFSSSSLRLLIGTVALMAILFAGLFHRREGIECHNRAIAELQNAGAGLSLEAWNSNQKVFSRSWYPVTRVAMVSFSSPELSESAILSLVPHLKNLIPKEDEDEIELVIQNDGRFSSDFIGELQDLLPNYEIVNFLVR